PCQQGTRPGKPRLAVRPRARPLRVTEISRSHPRHLRRQPLPRRRPGRRPAARHPVVPCHEPERRIDPPMNSTTYRWLLESHIEQTRAHLQRLETELEKIDAAEAEASRKQEREARRRRFNVNAEAVDQAKAEMAAAQRLYLRGLSCPDPKGSWHS